MFRRGALLALLAAAGQGCASKYARFRDIPVAPSDPQVVFNATEQVLRRYFAEFQARSPEQGLLTTGKSKVFFGNLPEQEYMLTATALVQKRKDHCVVRLKVQRSRIKGAWTWFGLGSDFYEYEVLSGPDIPLTDKIESELKAALGVPKRKPAGKKPSAASAGKPVPPRPARVKPAPKKPAPPAPKKPAPPRKPAPKKPAVQRPPK